MGENLVIVSNFLIIVAAADIQITNLATRKILIENLVLLDPTIGSSCFTKFRFFCLSKKLISRKKLLYYYTMYNQEKEEVLQYYLILPRKVLFDSFVKKKLRINNYYEHFL